MPIQVTVTEPKKGTPPPAGEHIVIVTISEDDVPKNPIPVDIVASWNTTELKLVAGSSSPTASSASSGTIQWDSQSFDGSPLTFQYRVTCESSGGSPVVSANAQEVGGPLKGNGSGSISC